MQEKQYNVHFDAFVLIVIITCFEIRTRIELQYAWTLHAGSWN